MFINHHRRIRDYLKLGAAPAAEFISEGRSPLDHPGDPIADYARDGEDRRAEAMSVMAERLDVPEAGGGHAGRERRSLCHTASSEAVPDHKHVRPIQKYFHMLNHLEEGAERAMTSS